MKKRWMILLALALALGTALSASALIGPQYVNTSNGKGVNLRAAPSKDSEILTTIPYGAMVDSYDYYDNSWGQVAYNGYYGFAMSRYFSSYRPDSKPVPAPTAKPGGGDMYRDFTKTDYYATVCPSTPSGYVNLRWAPSKSAPIQSTYYAGYSLHVIAYDGQWAQVYDEGTQTCGYMMRAFLTEYSGDGGIGTGAYYGG